MQIQAENTASVAAETVEAKAQLQVALARIAELEAALRNLDDLIVDLDMGFRELYQVSDFIDAALAGGKKDG
jgi:hypothetical protein